MRENMEKYREKQKKIWEKLKKVSMYWPFF